MLVTADNGGVALIAMPARRVVFSTVVSGAHSAEFLPNGRVVVVATPVGGPSGDPPHNIALFDTRRGTNTTTALWSTPATEPHRAVFTRGALYVSMGLASGEALIHEYALSEWNTSRAHLRLHNRTVLPGLSSAHDLTKVATSITQLALCTSNHVWMWDLATHTVTPFGDSVVYQMSNVKGISSSSHGLAVVQQGWNQQIQVVGSHNISTSFRCCYKARWLELIIGSEFL